MLKPLLGSLRNLRNSNPTVKKGIRINIKNTADTL